MYIPSTFYPNLLKDKRVRENSIEVIYNLSHLLYMLPSSIYIFRITCCLVGVR